MKHQWGEGKDSVYDFQNLDAEELFGILKRKKFSGISMRKKLRKREGGAVIKKGSKVEMRTNSWNQCGRFFWYLDAEEIEEEGRWLGRRSRRVQRGGDEQKYDERWQINKDCYERCDHMQLAIKTPLVNVLEHIYENTDVKGKTVLRVTTRVLAKPQLQLTTAATLPLQ